MKVLEQQEILPFERMKDKIIRCQTRRHGMDKGTRAFVEKLKKEYHYMPDKAGIDELLAKGDSVSLEEIRANIVARDKADMTRAISPLRQADDAVVLDNSHMTVEEQMTWFMERFDRIACGR